MSPPGCEAVCCSTPLKTVMLGKLWLPYASPIKEFLCVVMTIAPRTGFDSAWRYCPQITYQDSNHSSQ